MDEQAGIAVMTYPRLRLDFYNTAVLLSRWEEDGRTATYPVAVQDVVGACTRMALNSGLLPPDALFWRQEAGQTTLGIYVPARRWWVQTEERRFHVPMPPFIFVGSGTAYKIFAVKKRPALSGPTALGKSKGLSGEHDPLFHAPCPNVHATGGICQGNTPFPACSAQTLLPALRLFLESSLFNADLSQGKCRSHPHDVRRLWAELDGKKRFPLKELAPLSLRMSDLL